MGPISEASPKISRYCAYKMAALLHLLDFDISDLSWWIGGVYTHARIPHDHIKTAISALRHLRPRPGYPVQDCTRALQILKHSAPILAAYLYSWQDVVQRNLYDNHSEVAYHGPAVLKKIVSGCNNHFTLAFPRWIWRFICGLCLSPIGFVLCNVKGWIVVDPSSHIVEDANTGAFNGLKDNRNTTDVPIMFYTTAQRRHWTQISS